VSDIMEYLAGYIVINNNYSVWIHQRDWMNWIAIYWISNNRKFKNDAQIL